MRAAKAARARLSRAAALNPQARTSDAQDVPTPPVETAFRLPLRRRITPTQWRRIEGLLDDWKGEVLDAAKRHPAKSYRLGMSQVEAFADLLSGLNTETARLGNTAELFGGTSASMREAEAWSRTYTMRELDDALNVYVGRIKDALLYGLRGALNPTQVASAMFKATRDASINWRMIARTEMVRANAEGRLAAIAASGIDKVWCPPHIGACRRCREVLEGKVFNLADVQGKTNFGRKPFEYLPVIPLHPQCRHSWLPYIREVYEDAMGQYARMEAAGLTDEDRLDDLFDSSGQLKDGVDPALFDAAKMFDLYGEGLAASIAVRHGSDLTHVREVVAKVLHVDAADLAPELVAKATTLDAVLAPLVDDGTVDAAPVQLDPLVFDGGRLRDDVAMAIETWWEAIAGDDWREFSRLQLPSYGPPAALVDYDALRAARPAWAKLPDTDLHFALLIASRNAGGEYAHMAPGVPMDLRISPAPESVPSSPTWDLATHSWLGGEPDVALKTLGDVFPDYVWKAARDQPRAPKGTREGGEWVPSADHDTDLPKSVNSDESLKAHLLAQSKKHGGAWVAWVVFGQGKQLHYRRRSDVPAHFAERSPAGLAVDGKWMPWTDAQKRKAAADPDDHGDGSNAKLRMPAAYMRAARRTRKTHDDGGDYSYPAIALDPAALISSAEYEARVAKRDAAAASPRKETQANAGVEHWITIHPHGDDEKGQPVLVRNGADGTMTVIGGAGGNLNMLRLDPARRVDRDEKTGLPKGASGAEREGGEQAVSDDEQERMDAEREAQVQAAHEALEKAKGDRADVMGGMAAFAKDELGVDFDQLDPAAKRKMLKKLRVSALRTLAYGPIQARDDADSADAEQLKHPAATDAPTTPAADGEEDGEPRTPRPQVALSEDQARAWLEFHHRQMALSKIAGQQRRIIAGEASAADANQIDWSLGGQAAADEKSSKAATALIRTDLTRSAIERADTYYDGKKWNSKYRSSFQQGAFDTVDAFSHSILGESMISKPGADLLGVAGAAQLVAHAIQQKVAASDVGHVGGDKGVEGALKALTDDREATVNRLGMARVNGAIQRATEAFGEITASEKGQSLYTTTMARSIASQQVITARRQLAGMVGGLEATSALKEALDRAPGEKIKVGGWATPSDIKKACEKAHVKVRASEIKKLGAGNYVLSIDPDRLMGLVRPSGQGDVELRKRLEHIRTGEGLEQEVEAARRGPGMSDVLDRNQAKGKMFLRAAGSGVLAFDPGVGKTHTALGAAMEVMHDAGQQPGDPNGKHKVLIVAPSTMLGSWADTIRSQHGGHTVSVVGEKDSDSPAKKKAALAGDADFTIVSYESLKAYQDVLRQRGHEGRAHSIVIADELQKAKNQDTANHTGVETAVKLAAAQHTTDAHFWGLTGTPIEKSVTDINAMQRLAHLAKGKNATDRAAYKARYGSLGQDEHIARGDKIRQFRQGLDEDLFRLKAKDAGNKLPEPKRTTHKVTLDPEHRAEYQQRVNNINRVIAEDNEKGRNGELPLDANGRPKRRIQFGGRDALMDALYGRQDSAIAKGVADAIVNDGGKFHFDGMPADGPAEPGEQPKYRKGDNAGDYAHKHVVFGSNETSKALFGEKPGGGGFDPKGNGGLAKMLRDRGVKVYLGHGQMGGSMANQASYKAFVADPGKAVFLTNDTNNAGISLQFGDNKGAFQYGATQMHHFTVPVNNATIQQREARILRKGSVAPVQYHDYDAGTPIEQRLREQLSQEKRTQDLAANSEQLVSTAGEDDAKTLAHHLADRGIKAA